MQYPDPAGSYKALQASIKAADQAPEADSMVSRLTAGTTSVRKDYQIMFVGEHVMLAKWKGGSCGSGMSRYHVPGDVKIVPRTAGYERRQGIGFDCLSRPRVWNLDTQSDKPDSGRLQGQPLRDLMAKVIDLDKNYVYRLARYADARRATHVAEQAADEARRNAATAATTERHKFSLRVGAALRAAGFTADEINRVRVA